MDNRFANYFSRRIGQMASFPASYRRTADLSFVLAQIPESWRSDARYFLVRNVELMVLAPLRAVARSTSSDFLSSDKTFAVVSRDVSRIVALAEATAHKRDRRYVSATSVAIALGQLAPDLESTSFQIWGPD